MNAMREIAIDLEANQTASENSARLGETGVLAVLLSRFVSLPIGRKITLFFAMILAVAAIAGTVGAIALKQTSERVQETANAHRGAYVAQQLVTQLSNAQDHIDSFATDNDAEKGRLALSELDRALFSLDELGALSGTSTLAYSQRLTQITRSVVDHRASVNNALSGPLPARGPVGSNEEGTLFPSMIAPNTLSTARGMAHKLEERASASVAASHSSTTMVLYLSITAGIILCLIAFVAQRFFHNHVGAALSRLADQMTQLSTGVQTTEIRTSERQDEIGEMTRAMVVFHKAGMRLERLSHERSQRAEEELKKQALLQKREDEARIEKERTLNRIADNFETMVRNVVGQVASASSQLQSTAASMADSAKHASIRTSEVTGSMLDANAGTTAAAAASDEFAMSINEVSKQAASSAELARKATASAHEADTTLSQLSQSAEQVGDIVELIQTIAQRTNLLALNASIEAARGGEAGRGFAVVASEVKELAMQTSRATEEIAMQIREMQDTAGNSVSALRSIAKEVSGLENVAVSIAGAVDQQSCAGKDLAHSIEIAANGTRQVSEHIEEVQELSTSTGAAASQVLASATSLEKQAATLRRQVNVFLEEVRAA